MPSKKTLTVLEAPWEDHNDEVAEHSMRPFVEGLCALCGWRLIYRTFTTGNELLNLVRGEAFDNADRAVLYVASHGSGGRLQAGVRDTREINLASIAESLVKEVEGVWIGACDVGTSRSMERFLARRGTLWAGGYTCAVDWDASMLIDIAVLNEVMVTRASKSVRSLVDLFHDCFYRFDGGWEVGVRDRGSKVELRDALCVWARDAVRGRPKDITEDLLDALEWTDDDDEDDD